MAEIEVYVESNHHFKTHSQAKNEETEQFVRAYDLVDGKIIIQTPKQSIEIEVDQTGWIVIKPLTTRD